MIAAFLSLLLAATEPPTVKLTPEETAVIAATMEVAFPHHGRTLLVVNVLPQATTSAPGSVRSLNTDVRMLEPVTLGRPVKMITVYQWANTVSNTDLFSSDPAGAVILTRPAIEGDLAAFEYQSMIRTSSGLDVGHSEVTLERTASGWSVARLHYFRDFPHVSEALDAPAPPPAPAVRPAPSVPLNAADAPLRVGGDVKAPVVEYRVNPIATPEAKAAHVSGIVILEIIVDTTGKVTDAKILKPLPFGLDQAALDAVRQWRFRPGTLNGMPVAVIYNITMNFKDGD